MMPKLFVALFTILLLTFFGVALADSFKIQSPAFSEGQAIPREYTSDGQGLSPPLQWKGIPRGTRELVLVVEDPDAPKPKDGTGAFTQWIVYGISPDMSGLPQGIPPAQEKIDVPVSLVQGKNSQGKDGYAPPDPPTQDSPHRYQFRLFALDKSVSLKPGTTKSQLLSSIQSHVLDETILVGTYAKSRATS